jgi:hypothetical protein
VNRMRRGACPERAQRVERAPVRTGEGNNRVARRASTHKLTPLVTLILLVPVTLRAGATARPLPLYDWAVNASPNLATMPPPEAAVRQFMEQRHDNGESNVETRICSFRFVNLRKAENLTLLVTRWDGPRGGCGGLSIVDRTPAGFQEVSGEGSDYYGIDDVNRVVRDINGDGKIELVFYNQFTDYEGAECAATWPVIYGWDGSRYANLSAQRRFRRFYEQEIKRLQQEVANTRRTESMYKDPIGRGPPSDGARCAEASIAKIQRFLGAAADTGLADAIRWAKSRDRLEREFAAGVLSDIGTPEARNYLRTLANDPDRVVASSAKTDFAYRHFGKKEPEAEFLESDDASPDEQQDQMNKDERADREEPWHLIVPPMKGDKVDLKASDSKWSVEHGFDSREQCEVGVQLMQQEREYGAESINYLHGKCIRALTH